MDETELMTLLAQQLAAPAVQTRLMEIAGDLERELVDSPVDEKSTFRAIPLDLYEALPSDIRSSWLFHLRAGMAHPAERHPNSVQRMFAFNRPGWFDWWDGSRWVSQLLTPGGAGLSIPKNSWHRMPAQPYAWTVVSFHTADPDALIEIVGDPGTGATVSKRQYLAGA